jgi:thiol-disulfide isomerase/thioredoxin
MMLRIISLLLCCVPLLAAAEPKKVERFDTKTWAQLQKELPRPSVVVFTATYCSNCPALIDRIAQQLTKQGLKQDIVAVVVDEATPQELLASHHYKSVSKLFAFDGNEATLRYGVDPRWRGVTPYVALLSAPDKVVFIAGTPSDAQFEAWLKR